MTNVRLVSVTEYGEETLAYCARVSSPQNQENTATASKLLRYCMRNGHWSVFAMADMTVEIVTSRVISAQLLRHKSFDFQEFSQRYAEVTEFEVYAARRQDTKNRQNSIDDLPAEDKAWFTSVQHDAFEQSLAAYREAISRGIAKECARFLLPMSTTTRLYMKGNVRSWIHYLKVRTDPSTQLEHREIAEAIKAIFAQQFPTVAEVMDHE